MVLLGFFVAVAAMPACSEGLSFEVGDCVRIVQRLADFNLEEAECSEAVGTFDPDPTARIYRINQIVDGTEGECPEFQGFFPVEFAHEPDGVTYCLVQES